MASAGSEPVRTLSREEVISQVLEKLSTIQAKVSPEEVAEIVDGLANSSGQYDQDAIRRAAAEALKLWSSRDQLGFLCTLRLHQEHLMDVQRKTIEKLEAQNLNMKAQIEETVAEKIAELRHEVMMMLRAQQESFPSSQGAGYSGQETQREGQEPNETDVTTGAFQHGAGSVAPHEVEDDKSTVAAIEIFQKLQELEGKVAKSLPEAEIEEKLGQNMAELQSELMTIFEVQQEGPPLQAGYPEQQENAQEEQHKEAAEMMKKLEEKFEKKMSEVESKLVKMIKESESLRLGGGVAEPQEERTQEVQGGAGGVKTQKQEEESAPAKVETEEEKRKQAIKQEEDKVWEHLTNYDEAFKELQTDPERNSLTNFKDLSESIVEKHDVLAKVKVLLPEVYFNPLARNGCSTKLNYQPFMSNLDELMKFHEDKKPAFDAKVTYVANQTQGKAVIPQMKGRDRCSAKAAFKYTDETGTSWHRCTDIVRATILYDDIASMYDGLKLLDQLHEEKEIEIIEFNDRYQVPMPGNYRDLQLAVKIQDMVAELQLNTKAMAYVKENAGHRSFEVSRELIAAVKESDSQRCDTILSWGKEQVGEASIQDILNSKTKPVLHEAAKQGNADLMNVFIRYGADVNLQTADGQTALHKATAGGHERAVWLLLCKGAKFVADNKGITPLMECLLQVRVDPSNETKVRCVSTVAQKCGPEEFENLHERLEVCVKERLRQSSDLVTACRDGNLQKAERFLRDWADPNSRDSSGQHAIHAALYSAHMDFTAERAAIVRTLLEFRGDANATVKSPEGEDLTGLDIAVRSCHPKAHLGAALLIQRGATFMGTCIRDSLPSFKAGEMQGAAPLEVVRMFAAEWFPGFPTPSQVDVEQLLSLKASALELLLLRGYEAAKQFGVEEAARNQAAFHVADVLKSFGHRSESIVFLCSECSPTAEDDALVYVVSGAGGMGFACNGEYRQVREHNGKPLYQKEGDKAIIYFDKRWKISGKGSVHGWIYMAPDAPGAAPPPGQWTTEGYDDGDADPAPVVSCYKDQQQLPDHSQQMEYWLDLAAAASSQGQKQLLLHTAVSCQALQEILQSLTSLDCVKF